MLRLALEGITLDTIIQICRARIQRGWRKHLNSGHECTVRGLNRLLRLGSNVVDKRLVKKTGLLILCACCASYRETA